METIAGKKGKKVRRSFMPDSEVNFDCSKCKEEVCIAASGEGHSGSTTCYEKWLARSYAASSANHAA